MFELILCYTPQEKSYKMLLSNYASLVGTTRIITALVNERILYYTSL